MKISDITLFQTTLPILPTPPFLWKKYDSHSFFQKFRKLNKPSFITGRGVMVGGSNYALAFSS